MSDEDTDKANGPQFIWLDFIGVFYAAKTSAIIILPSLFGKLFLWNVNYGVFMRLYPNFQHIITVF